MVDMRNAGVGKALLDRLRGLIRGCKKKDQDDKLLDIVLGMWRRGK